MDIIGMQVQSAAFGKGVVAEQAETIVTVDFQGVAKKFDYPSAFEQFLTLEDADAQCAVRKELALVKAKEHRAQQAFRRDEELIATQQREEARAAAARKKRPSAAKTDKAKKSPAGKDKAPV